MAATSNNYFRPIRGRSSIADHLLEWAQSKAPVWQQHNSFDLARPPISLIKQDPLVSQLLTGFNADPAVIRMEPQRFYRPHRDQRRTVAVNLLLTPGNSLSFWLDDPLDTCPDQSHITRLDYAPHCYYLYNTEITHAVINLDQPRLLLSMGFYSPVTWQILSDYLSDRGLFDL